MKRNHIIIAALFTISTLVISCKSSSEATTEKTVRSEQKRVDDRPNLETIFTQMDANKDGKISKSEAKGPLSKSFSTIDANEDGYISKEELKKAPKPSGQQRPRN